VTTTTTDKTGSIHHCYDLGELDSYQYVTFTMAGRRVMLWTFNDSDHPSVDAWTTAADDDGRTGARLALSKVIELPSRDMPSTVAMVWPK
jgi:hypothetical protein